MNETSKPFVRLAFAEDDEDEDFDEDEDWNEDEDTEEDEDDEEETETWQVQYL